MSPRGHTYRVGRDHYVDNSALQDLARQVVVEPMLGGYQMLLPDAVVRLTHVAHAPLPDQHGRLYRCSRADGRSVGPMLRVLAGPPSAEWEEWPRNVAIQQSCGCHATASAGHDAPCACKVPPADRPAPHVEPQRESPAQALSACVVELLDALSPGSFERLQEHDEATRLEYFAEVLPVISHVVRRASSNVELAKTLLADLHQVVRDTRRELDILGSQ